MCSACQKTFIAQSASGTAVAPKAPGTAVAPKSAGTKVAPRAPGAAAPKAPAPPSTPKAASAAAPPPVPSAGRPWHLHIDGRTVGPYAAATVVDQVKTGKIPTETLAWKEGMADWQPLSEIPDFHAPLGTAIRRQKGAAVHEHGHEREHERDREERRRFVPGRSARQDKMIALFGLGGLLVIGLIVILITLGKSKNESARRPALQPLGGQPAVPSEPRLVIDLTPKPSTVAAAAKAPAGPRLMYPELTNEAYFAKFKTDLAKSFQDAIAAHKLAKAAPIHALARTCKKSAEELARRQWVPPTVQVKIDSLVAQLRNASEKITGELKGDGTNPGKEFTWAAEAGVQGPARATVLGVDNVKWLEGWQSMLGTFITPLKEDGY